MSNPIKDEGGLESPESTRASDEDPRSLR